MSIAKRIVSGTAVNVAGMAMTATAQILSVPLLTSFWGVERYGFWLMLTTVPAYLALSDLGFASAATSDMTMQIARGHRSSARATFQSVLLLVNAVTTAILIATLGLIIALPSLSAAFSWLRDQSFVLIILVIYSGLSLNARIALAGLRATKDYALGTMLNQLMTFTEVLVTILAAYLGKSFVICTLTMLFMQAVNIAVMFATLNRRSPWLRAGIAHASFTEVRRLTVPAIAAMAIPAALAVNLQGTVIIAGAIISASAAATFASVRTVSRIAVQLVGAVNRATMPELSAAGATNKSSTSRKIIALNLVTAALILFPAAILFAMVGSRVVDFWTGGRIQPAPQFVALVGLAMAAHGLWYYTSNLMLAFNEHTKVTNLLVAVSAATLLVAVPATSLFGLPGLGGTLLISELTCLWGVLRVARKSGLIGVAELEAALKFRFWRA